MAQALPPRCLWSPACVCVMLQQLFKQLLAEHLPQIMQQAYVEQSVVTAVSQQAVAFGEWRALPAT